MSAAIPQEVGTKLLKWLGIDDRRVRGFTLRVRIGELVSIQIDRMAETPVCELEPIITEYVLIPKSDAPRERDITDLASNAREYAPGLQGMVERNIERTKEDNEKLADIKRIMKDRLSIEKCIAAERQE